VNQKIKLAVLCGSVRMGRKSPLVAEYVANEFKSKSEIFEVTYIDLAEYNLPIMQERRGHHPNLPAIAEKLGQQLESADALVVVTPEYNGSYPGVLKNALDYFLDEVSKRPVGVVSVSGGRMGGNHAWQSLTAMFLRIGAFVAPARFHVAEVGKVFNDNGEVVSDHFKKSANRFTSEFQWFAEAILEKKRG
jgi:azobenzene reductase